MILLNLLSVLVLLGCVCVVCVWGHGWREPLDCVRALELCNGDSQCSSSYRIMRQCLSGGARDRQTMLAGRECQGAIEVLQDSSLYDCRCKRAMKKELQCLQNYWSIHQGLTESEMEPLKREAESFVLQQIREYSHGVAGPQEDASTMNSASISTTVLQKYCFLTSKIVSEITVQLES
nr:GDNF family receptor alpha-2-like [Oncorhynchus nerka]